MSDYVRIRFEGTIMLDAIELESQLGDPVAAAQSALDYSGATVTDAQVDDFLADDYVPPLPDDESYEEDEYDLD